MDCSFGNIDLHIHSTFSDGSLDPAQILEHAVKKGLSAISITDHDNTAGALQALCHGIPETLEFIAGIEISAAYPPSFENSGSLHLLGYGMDPEHPKLNQMLEKQRSARSGRNPLVIEKLNAMGIPADIDAVVAATGKKDIARPHIADFLVKTGYATDIDDAFDRFLGRGKPAYVDKYRIPAEDAIRLIREAGGIAVLAHPMLLSEVLFEERPEDFPGKRFESLLDTLLSYGLEGIEAYYPGHTPAQTSFLIETAGKRGLLVTGGTDFHGDINPDIEMGSGRGDFSVPYDIFQTLKNALAHG
ncbi:MAG: PHP domain-containing protein [Desulfosalsimonadaceae bacterium]